MKKAIVALACVLIVPLAFGQTSSTVKKQGASTAETITITGTTVTEMPSEEGAAASYQPAKTLVIRTDGAKDSSRYVLNGPGRIVDKKGEVVRSPVNLAFACVFIT